MFSTERRRDEVSNGFDCEKKGFDLRILTVSFMIAVLWAAAVGTVCGGEKRVYMRSSPEGSELWRQIRNHRELATLLTTYARVGLEARGDFFYNETDSHTGFLIPLGDSPLVDPQTPTSASPDAMLRALAGDSVYVYFILPKNRPLPPFSFALRSRIVNGHRVFSLEMGPQSLTYDSLNETLKLGKPDETNLAQAAGIDYSRLWQCLLSYLGISGVTDVFSLIDHYCMVDASVQGAVQMVNGCVNPLNIINCAIGVSAWLGCGIAGVVSCYNAGSADFSLSSNPSSRIITQGQSTTFTIAATFVGGFTGPVSGFAVSNLHTGATASFSPTSITGSGGSTNLSIATTADTVVQDRQITVSASGGGITRSVVVELNVNPAATGGGTSLSNGQSVSGSLAQGQEVNYQFAVPSGASQLVVDMTGTGDADLYVRYGSQPTLSAYDCRPYTSTANERCTFNNPSSGTWFIMVRGYSSSSSFTLTPTYSGGTGGGGGTAGLQVSFVPNPVALTSVNSCTSGSGYQFTFNVTSTNGVGLTPTVLAIDGDTSFTPDGFTQHINPGGTNSFGLYWCRGAGSSVWAVTSNDDNGHSVTATGTLFMQ